MAMSRHVGLMQMTVDSKQGTYGDVFGNSLKWTGRPIMLLNVSVRSRPLKGVVAYYATGKSSSMEKTNTLTIIS